MAGLPVPFAGRAPDWLQAYLVVVGVWIAALQGRKLPAVRPPLPPADLVIQHEYYLWMAVLLGGALVTFGLALTNDSVLGLARVSVLNCAANGTPGLCTRPRVARYRDAVGPTRGFFRAVSLRLVSLVLPRVLRTGGRYRRRPVAIRGGRARESAGGRGVRHRRRRFVPSSSADGPPRFPSNLLPACTHQRL